MTEHTEKKQIFDTYAKEQGCMSFENLLAWHKVGDKTMIEHIFAACDLVQKEQQKRIADKLPSGGEIFLKNEATKDLILSESNLIK